MSPKIIAVIGALDLDLIMLMSRIPDRGEIVLANHYREVLGGKGENTAIATYRTCYKNSHAKPNEIKTALMIRGSSQSPIPAQAFASSWFEDQTRENRCLFMPGATATWRKADFINAKQLGGGTQPDIVVVETMLATAGKAASISICHTFLLVNKHEAAIISGRDRDGVNPQTCSVIAHEFLSRGVGNVVITLGANGAFYANSEGNGHCPAFDVKVEDTTGAGDTLTGAAIIRANKAATIKVQSLGAQEGTPWSDDLDNFDAPAKRLDFIRSESPAYLSS
ncbi:ribokinase [Fusarium sp. MPI-SDFR-AT-0072]|nr:ribokinase [Fusarium sp. MPI-SDFR-AT-0072]